MHHRTRKTYNWIYSYANWIERTGDEAVHKAEKLRKMHIENEITHMFQHALLDQLTRLSVLGKAIDYF